MTVLARQTVDLTWHAIERFQERMFSGVDLVLAGDRLEQLVQMGTFSIDALVWLRAAGAPTHT